MVHITTEGSLGEATTETIATAMDIQVGPKSTFLTELMKFIVVLYIKIGRQIHITKEAKAMVVDKAVVTDKVTKAASKVTMVDTILRAKTIEAIGSTECLGTKAAVVAKSIVVSSLPYAPLNFRKKPLIS